jgi:hypothetical protein
MSDEQNVPPKAEQTSGAESGTGDAWRDVVAQLEAFTEAVGRWAKAAVQDPDNKRRVEELKAGMDKIASSIGEAADKAADSEVGQSFKEAAGKTGDAFKVAGQKIGSEVGPHLAGAFKTASDKLREAADKIEQKTETPTEEPTEPKAE